MAHSNASLSIGDTLFMVRLLSTFRVRLIVYIYSLAQTAAQKTNL